MPVAVEHDVAYHQYAGMFQGINQLHPRVLLWSALRCAPAARQLAITSSALIKSMASAWRTRCPSSPRPPIYAGSAYRIGVGIDGKIAPQRGAAR